MVGWVTRPPSDEKLPQEPLSAPAALEAAVNSHITQLGEAQPGVNLHSVGQSLVFPIASSVLRMMFASLVPENS